MYVNVQSVLTNTCIIPSVRPIITYYYIGNVLSVQAVLSLPTADHNNIISIECCC